MKSGDSFADDSTSKKSSAITLVSYRKTDDYFNSDQIVISTATTGSSSSSSGGGGRTTTASSSSSSTTMGSDAAAVASIATTSLPETASLAAINTQTKLSMIKAELLAASKVSSTPVQQQKQFMQPQQQQPPQPVAPPRRESLSKGAVEAKIAHTYAASASDLLFGSDKHASSDENSAVKRVNDLSADLKQVYIIHQLFRLVQFHLIRFYVATKIGQLISRFVPRP